MKLFFVLLFLNLFAGCNDMDLMATESLTSESSEGSSTSNLLSIDEEFLENLLVDFNALETRVDNIENEMEVLEIESQGQIQSLQMTLASSITGLSNQITNLSNQMEVLEIESQGQVQSLQLTLANSITAISNSVSTLETNTNTQISSLNTNLTNLSNQMEVLEIESQGQVQSLQMTVASSVTALSDQIAGLSNQMEVLEIESQGQIQSLQTTLAMSITSLSNSITEQNSVRQYEKTVESTFTCGQVRTVRFIASNDGEISNAFIRTGINEDALFGSDYTMVAEVKTKKVGATMSSLAVESFAIDSERIIDLNSSLNSLEVERGELVQINLTLLPNVLAPDYGSLTEEDLSSCYVDEEETTLGSVDELFLNLQFQLSLN